MDEEQLRKIANEMGLQKFILLGEKSENEILHGVCGYNGIEAMGIIEIMKPRILKQIEQLSKKE